MRSSFAILPPIVGLFSTKCTSNPSSAKSIPADNPATPPPIIKAFLVISTSLTKIFSKTAARATADFKASSATLCAPSLSCLWTKLECSRILANYKYEESKSIDSNTDLNTGSWVLGVHAATTSLFAFT